MEKIQKNKKGKDHIEESKKNELLLSSLSFKHITFGNKPQNKVIKDNNDNKIKKLYELPLEQLLKIHFKKHSNFYNDKNYEFGKEYLSPIHKNNSYDNNKITLNKQIQANNFPDIDKQKAFQHSKLSKTLYTNFYKNNELIFKKFNICTHYKNFKNDKDKRKTDINNSIKTNYLKRKLIDNIPITFPLYLSYNNIFDSNSQKERVKKNLDKLICIKTHLENNPDNHFKLIKEFMLKNGIYEEKYLKSENMIKLENYLKQPIIFNPKYTLKQIIKNVIDNKLIKPIINNELENEDLIQNQKPINYFISPLSESNLIKKNHKFKNKIYNNKSVILQEPTKKSNILKNNISHKNLKLTIFENNAKNFENNEKDGKIRFKLSKNNLKVLVKHLEDELNKLKEDKINKLDVNNLFVIKNSFSMKSLDDKNKLVPNLCLSAKGFSERYKSNINKHNNKLKNIISKQQQIKNINNRMYYNNIKKKNIKDFNLYNIRKNLKLTEFVAIKRFKKKLLEGKFENSLYENNKYKNNIKEK